MLTVVNKGEIMISKSTEEYLKTMYVLMKQKGIIRVTDIADKMNCSKPSVTKQLNILKENKLIDYETYGEIKITSLGEELAIRALADYDILYILLHDVIGINDKDSEREAVRIKGVISDDTLKSISDYIN
jgi:DtxR family Mn-dependent transcriptional regulator